MSAQDGSQDRLCFSASPAEMDQLWSEGWRHFGVHFFKYPTAVHGEKHFTVLPLRVDLERFQLKRSQKRVLARNRDVRTAFNSAVLDQAAAALFAKHRMRFTENRPSSLAEFLSPFPDSIPCRNIELRLYHEKRLIGTTYLDLGLSATSGVYAIFDPDEAKRSLGILMILQSIRFSLNRGYRYYYPGYAYCEPSPYDYKKRFIGLEYLDWTTGWHSYDE